MPKHRALRRKATLKRAKMGDANPPKKTRKGNKAKMGKRTACDSPKLASLTTEAPQKRRNSVASTAGPDDSEIVSELVCYLYSCAGAEYEDTGCMLHEQVYPQVRLNIYWTRMHVGIHDKILKRDVVNFTSKTATITTHLYLANLVERS